MLKYQDKIRSNISLFTFKFKREVDTTKAYTKTVLQTLG